MQLASAIALLFLVMDPIGNVPVFLSHLKDVPEDRRLRIVARESLIALGILMLFLLFGPWLMRLLAISRESLYISGGVLLFLISVGMIFPGGSHLGAHPDPKTDGEPFIVPLAVPLIAGPSTMAIIMVFRSGSEPFWLWLCALLVAWAITAAILMLAPSLSRLLGQRGLRACERLTGMLLTVVAVQMLLNGAAPLLRGKP